MTSWPANVPPEFQPSVARVFHAVAHADVTDLQIVARSTENPPLPPEVGRAITEVLSKEPRP